MEGLRAVAVGLVLLYHAGLPWVPGGFVGVDVFFVISGFLITSQLLSELDRTGSVSLVRFYARRAKRLLPAAAVTLAATVVLVRLFVPRVRWEEIGGDVAGAALYVINWRLAERSVDYLAEDSEASPVQHFWSLAVEEQFYFFWPLLILLTVVAATLLRARVRPVILLGLAAVAVPSLWWAVSETSREPERAFFVTTTRVWELAIGGAVALGAAVLPRLPRAVAVPLGWAGLASIGLSALIYRTDTPWPGYAAALPTLGTAAVIAAGFVAARGGPALLLGTAPMQAIGRLSYSLYLWHWPLLAVAAAYWDGLPVTAGVLIAVLSVVPAWLTYRYVENPIRHSRAVSESPRLALSLGANFTLLGVVAGLALVLWATVAVPASGPPRGQPLGAAVLAEQPRGDVSGRPVDDTEWFTPDPLDASRDVPKLYDDGCQQGVAATTVASCEYGDTGSEIEVAVVGDSKIAQWLPALTPLAEKHSWRLVTYTKSNCGFHAALTTVDGEPYRACRAWNEAVIRELIASPPDYILTSQRAAEAVGGDGRASVQAMVAGLRQAWSAVTAAGSEVVVIADNPHPGFAVYECVEENRDRLSACAYDRSRRDSASAAPTQLQAAQGQPDVQVVDLNDAICPTPRCAPVIGNVLIYRQGSHITATYIESLTPRLEAALAEAGLPLRAMTRDGS